MSTQRNSWPRFIGTVRARLGDSLDVRQAHDAWVRRMSADRYCNAVRQARQARLARQAESLDPRDQ
jgi:hypothetical protein